MRSTYTARTAIIAAFPSKNSAGLRAQIRRALRDPANPTAGDALGPLMDSVVLTARGQAAMLWLMDKIDNEETLWNL